MIIDHIDIQNKTKKKIDRKKIIRIIRITLDELAVKGSYNLGLFFVDKETIRRLNNKYRRINNSTDVLSFGILDKKDDFIDSPDNVLHLGDIFICPDEIKKQYEQTLDFGITNLLIHGILHIFGFTHNKKNDAEKMHHETEKILGKLIKQKIL